MLSEVKEIKIFMEHLNLDKIDKNNVNCRTRKKHLIQFPLISLPL